MNLKETIVDRKTLLSTIWIAYVINILYADVLNILGEASSVPVSTQDKDLIQNLVSPELLLFTAIFLETAIVMIVLSRLLKRNTNRVWNIVLALLHLMGILASLFVGTPAIYYLFFVSAEIILLSLILWFSWTWRNE